MPELETELLTGMGQAREGREQVCRWHSVQPAGETVPKARAQAAVTMRGQRKWGDPTVKQRSATGRLGVVIHKKQVYQETPLRQCKDKPKNRENICDVRM